MASPPNILITGSPGTGKTSLCEELAVRTGMQHINIGILAKERDCYDGYDEVRDAHILDEDKVIFNSL